jgi:hypothetical protein
VSAELVETVAVFVGSGAAAAVLNNIVADVYRITKKWARERKQKRPTEEILLTITIYGPDGDILASWWIIDDKVRKQ